MGNGKTVEGFACTPAAPGRVEAALCLLVVILFMHASGSIPLATLHAVLFTLGAPWCALGLVPRRVELHTVREVRVHAPTGHRDNVIYQDNGQSALHPRGLEKGW